MPDAALSLLCLSAALALVVDRVLGEPPVAWHPVVAMGWFLGLVGPRLSRLRPAPAWLGGALWWWLGVLIVAGLAAAAQLALLHWAGQGGGAWWGAALLGGLLLKPLLSWRLLRQEVLAVEQALGQSLRAGQTQLARLVSREVRALSAVDVREAALETLAENLNDSVIAPLCWFAVAGLPGAAVYRFANTADAMWGYRDHREWSGKWAARADDVLSWLPARLTALALCAAAGRWPGGRRLRAEAARPASPNGGWPMGALALLLGCRLGKPGVYGLNGEGATASTQDVGLALQWSGRVVWGLGALALSVASGLSLQGDF
jgi:adenosylcobinamide-phosphate synthase